MKNEKSISRMKAIASLILILVKIWIAVMPAAVDEKACPWRAPPTIEHPVFVREAQSRGRFELLSASGADLMISDAFFAKISMG
ncbi:hypothetical protein [Rhizobium johnstonii]|uniref:hypothetical protein n=1 Tax=Rhizobium johnstonii TaxID=3019933 RepID=UPI003F9CCDB8